MSEDNNVSDYAIRNLMKASGVPRVAKTSFPEIRAVADQYLINIGKCFSELQYNKIDLSVAKEALEKLHDYDWISQYKKKPIQSVSRKDLSYFGLSAGSTRQQLDQQYKLMLKRSERAYDYEKSEKIKAKYEKMLDKLK